MEIHSVVAYIVCYLDQVPATTLQSLASAVDCDGLSELKSSNPEKNAFRAADRYIRRWGLRWNIPFSYFHYSKDIVIPYLSPRAIVTFLLKRCPELLLGGVTDPKEAHDHLQAFWSGYREYHGSHPVFEHHPDFLRNVVPMLWHGDEGRGVRKSPTTVCSIETPFGLDSYSADCYNVCQCCSHGSKATLCARQNINLKQHSFLTKYVVLALPKKMYKDTTVIQDMSMLISRELRALFFEGVYVNNKLWHVACIGLKGDLAWFQKTGELQRCYTRLSKRVNMQMCHECLAGNQLHWEDLSTYPVWRDSIFTQRPWERDPASGIASIPYQAAAPEKILKRDVFHNAKIGCYQDYIGSSILLLADLRYFHSSEESNSRKRVLSRMHGHFLLWCQTQGKSPALMGFSKAWLNAPSRKHFGWAKCKGSDSMLLMEWLTIVTVACMQDLLDESHLSTLQAMHKGAESGVVWLKTMYKHGLWWSRFCATAINQHGQSFLQAYNFLAWVCLKKWNFPGYSFKPKIHMLKHEILDIQQMLDKGASVIPSTLAFSCEMNEDCIGRISRISRKVHQKNACERILDLYLTKCHALHRKWHKKRTQELPSSSAKRAR